MFDWFEVSQIVFAGVFCHHNHACDAEISSHCLL